MIDLLLERLRVVVRALVGGAALFSVLAWSSLASALTKNEVVLVLDNSGSMGSHWEFIMGPGQAKMMKPSDPERGAILGALMLEALVRGSQDRLTVISFTKGEAFSPPLLKQADEIKALQYNTGTFYRRPLQEARRILDGSPKGDGRVLLFFTDGIPTDSGLTPDELPKLIGLDADPELDSFALGLWSGETADPIDAEFQRRARGFLGRMVRLPDDLEFIAGGRQVVPAFTRAYARALGSRAEIGRLKPGQTRTVDAGKYVVEVLVATAASDPGPDYSARLAGPRGDVPARAGDNACVKGGGCNAPRRHFEAFRAENDPNQASKWSLTLGSAPGDVEYGFILRYDFTMAVAVKPVCNVGDQVPIETRMFFQGKPFADEAFFQADGFEAYALVGPTRVPMQHKGGGVFAGTFVPSAETKGLTLPVRGVLRNTWLDLHSDASTRVEGMLDLVLRANPNPIDLGSWKGERGLTSRCTRVDLAGSVNADRLEVTCQVQSASTPGRQVEGTCQPVAGSEPSLPSGMGRPLKWEVCAEAPRCPDDCVSDPSKPIMTVVFAGKDPRYAAGAIKVPVFYRVGGISWLACWWPLLAVIGGALFALWFIIGWVRPHNFEHGLSLRLAGSEAGLKRTSALVLREQPGGVRGFYRNARVCLNAAGDFVRSPRLGVIVIEAGPGGTTSFQKATGLERKDRRTNQWGPLPPEELPHGLAPGVTYRTGNLFFTVDLRPLGRQTRGQHLSLLGVQHLRQDHQPPHPLRQRRAPRRRRRRGQRQLVGVADKRLQQLAPRRPRLARLTTRRARRPRGPLRRRPRRRSPRRTPARRSLRRT